MQVIIRVISDNACPWCFVGKRNLEEAMKQFNNLEFNVEFFPFSLHGNTMPDDGMDLSDYIYKVYGSRINVNSPNSPLKLAGDKVGIKFNNSRKMVNTLDSHRLIALAKDYKKDLQMVEAIFHNYFEEALNISKIDNLHKIGMEILSNDISSSELDDFLKGTKYKDEILYQIEEAKNNFVTGVPSFTIIDPSNDKKHLLSGAQPPERFAHTFNAIQKNISGSGCL